MTPEMTITSEMRLNNAFYLEQTELGSVAGYEIVMRTESGDVSVVRFGSRDLASAYGNATAYVNRNGITLSGKAPFPR